MATQPDATEVQIVDRYVVIVTGIDGTKTAYGPTTSEYRATLAANETETEESGLLAEVVMLSPLTELTDG